MSTYGCTAQLHAFITFNNVRPHYQSKLTNVNEFSENLERGRMCVQR